MGCDHRADGSFVFHPDRGARSHKEEIASKTTKLKGAPKLEPLGGSPFNIVIAGRAGRTSTHDHHSRIQCIGAVLLCDRIEIGRGNVSTHVESPAPEGYCRHVLATMIYRRAQDLLRQSPPAAAAPLRPAEPVETPQVGSDPRFLVTLHGKKYIQYVGLLAMAHDRGLTSLKARFISVTPDLALAEAEAVFADGKVFMEAA